MADPDALLPPSSTPLERALSRSTGRFSPDRIVPTVWNADTCPASVLPYLAWALSVDEWDEGWSIEKKRSMVKEARAVHQTKGTLFSVRRVLSSIGQADAEIIERSDLVYRNGSTTRNGLHRRGGLAGWATYRVVLKQPVTVDQAYQIKRLLVSTQRNCIELVGINYPQSAIRHNGAVARNGSYARGFVNAQL